MTGLCRLIRDCAAQTAGPFVRRSERRKLAVLIPLFMSSREKKASTLQPCPLHPFRGQEEGGSGPVAPGACSLRAPGSPQPVKHCSRGGRRGCFAEASIVSFWKMGQLSHKQGILMGEIFIFMFLLPLTESTGRTGPSSQERWHWGCTPTIPIKGGLTEIKRPRGDARLGSSTERISLDRWS